MPKASTASSTRVTWDENVPGIAKAKEYCQKNHPADYGNMDYLSTWATVLVIREILTTAVKNVGYDALAKGGPDAWKAIEEQGIQKVKGYKIEGLRAAPLSYTPGDNRLDKYLRIYQVKGGKISPSRTGRKRRSSSTPSTETSRGLISR